MMNSNAYFAWLIWIGAKLNKQLVMIILARPDVLWCFIIFVKYVAIKKDSKNIISRRRQTYDLGKVNKFKIFPRTPLKK